jgi:hypothetical protein
MVASYVAASGPLCRNDLILQATGRLRPESRGLAQMTANGETGTTNRVSEGLPALDAGGGGRQRRTVPLRVTIAVVQGSKSSVIPRHPIHTIFKRPVRTTCMSSRMELDSRITANALSPQDRSRKVAMATGISWLPPARVRGGSRSCGVNGDRSSNVGWKRLVTGQAGAVKAFRLPCAQMRGYPGAPAIWNPRLQQCPAGLVFACLRG